jgi:hypothetical protein
MSTHEFVDRLLETEPGAPHTVQLEIDCGGDPAALFEVLLLIMTDILKRWYAPPITIGAISDVDYARLVGYFASFGIRFQLSVINISNSLPTINNRAYLNQSRLEDMKFQMAHNGKIYTARFSNLPAA